MELFELNLRDAAEGVRTKKFSALELFDACFARAASCEPTPGSRGGRTSARWAAFPSC